MLFIYSYIHKCHHLLNLNFVTLLIKSKIFNYIFLLWKCSQNSSYINWSIFSSPYHWWNTWPKLLFQLLFLYINVLFNFSYYRPASFSQYTSKLMGLFYTKIFHFLFWLDFTFCIYVLLVMSSQFILKLMY